MAETTKSIATDFRIKNTAKGRQIFDPVRKKFVSCTPEEVVRQRVLNFLLSRKRIPINLINVEKQLLISQRTKRYDLVVYNRDGSVFLIVECKAPNVKISQATFDQIARYNMSTRAANLMVSNGEHNYFCAIDYKNQSYSFMNDLPNYTL
ncbi:MAG: type I restriction enzyme HsdR N-terminal domain-containing protein [Nonlabens sp.]